MNRVTAAVTWLCLWLCLGSMTACSSVGAGDYGWFGRQTQRRAAGSGFSIVWTKSLVNDELTGGHYLPVEYAVPELNAARDRIYVGSTEGRLLALSSNGHRVYQYNARGSVQAPPALDAEVDEIYLATEDGQLHALRASNGERRWQKDIGGSVRKAPVLGPDAVYVVTQTDRVMAFARDNGDLLWTYERPMPEGFTISTRAGLAYVGGRILTGFTDGAVVAVDATDGRLVWEVPTAIDVEQEPGSQQRFLDVDTTPLVIDDVVYVASFAAGLYAMALSNGTVQWREADYTGVVGLAGDSDRLLLASADLGVVALDPESRARLWQKETERGAPTEPVIAHGLVFVGESEGSFYGLSLVTGREVGRINSGRGFSARAAVERGRGFVLSNGGTLYSFQIAGS